MNSYYITGSGEKINLDQALSPDAENLNNFLNQYSKLKKAKHSLEETEKEIKSEFNSPLKAIVYDGMPKAKGGISNGAAALPLKLDEIRNRINNQQNKMVETLGEILKIFELLPMESSERNILEKKYILGKRWNQISYETSFSRAGTIIYWKRGLYILLEFEAVRNTLTEWERSEEIRKMGLAE